MTFFMIEIIFYKVKQKTCQTKILLFRGKIERIEKTDTGHYVQPNRPNGRHSRKYA